MLTAAAASNETYLNGRYGIYLMTPEILAAASGALKGLRGIKL